MSSTPGDAMELVSEWIDRGDPLEASTRGWARVPVGAAIIVAVKRRGRRFDLRGTFQGSERPGKVAMQLLIRDEQGTLHRVSWRSVTAYSFVPPR
jgi:hypothetical protein